MVYFGGFLGVIVFGGSGPKVSAVPKVTDDWLTVLPREKANYFDYVVGHWECTYAMMSIALDDALSLRTRGELVCARQQVSVASALLGRLAESLTSLCDTLSIRARRIANLPQVKPLKPAFFRGNTAQSAASWNAILHHVLFGNRSRFFHKVRILSETLADITREFDEAASDISKGLSVEPTDCWTHLDLLHYDFNTCLRETEVVLKSFLRVLPADQLAGMSNELDALAQPAPVRIRPRLSRASA
jgi:hypothetical protein